MRESAASVAEFQPPDSVTLTFTGPWEPAAITVHRDAGAFGVSTGGDTPIGILVAVLDLSGIDRLIAILQRVQSGDPPIQDQPAATSRLDIETGTTRIRSDAAEQTVDTTSLRLGFGQLREFVASWTDGQYVDVALLVGGAAQTHRMARDARGDVQLVRVPPLRELSMLLLDLQDPEIIDAFLDEIREVLEGRAPENQTGGNSTNLHIGPTTTQLQHFWSEAVVSVGTRELHDELVRLRAFAAGQPGSQ